MGMERIVTFPGETPSWEAIMREANAAGIVFTVRMIDGLPAFPDEIPEENWNEVRVSASAGKITLRRQPHQLAVVVCSPTQDGSAGLIKTSQKKTKAGDGTIPRQFMPKKLN